MEKEEIETKCEQNTLISMKTKKDEMINNMLIFAFLTIVVIATSCASGIMVAIVSRAKKLEEEEKKKIADEQIEVKPEPTPKVPVYSEEAKDRMKNIYVQADDEKVAYLTFDDGPSSNITPQILNTLRNENIKATFFILGSRAELYPELVKQEYNEGHYIANHGYSHTYASIYSSPNAVLDEYNRTESIIQQAIGIDGYSSHLFRFPGGSEGGKYAKMKNQAKDLLEQNNISYINWNCLTNDAVGKPTHETLIKDLKLTSNRKK